MREILFRAKSLSSGEWVYGNFIRSKRFSGYSHEFRIHEIESGIESDVDPETVGQLIGFKDKIGVEIYENDKFSYEKHYGYNFESFVGEIKYQDGCFGFKVIEGQNYQDFTPLSEIDELQHDFLNHVAVVL